MEYLPLILLVPLGLIMGSFFNVCIWRIPRKESVVFPPSHCGSCGARIKSRDLIPVISYIFLKGKCRSCGNKISITYPFVEILTGAVYGLLYLKMGLTFEYLFMIILASIFIIVSFIDIKHKIIPDAIVLPGIFLGLAGNLIFNIFMTNGSTIFIPWYESLLGILAGGMPLYLIGLIGSKMAGKDAMGGGDIKLMAMTGAFLGWKVVLTALFFGVIAGALAGIIIKVKNRKEAGSEMPFGPALAAGSMIAALYGMEVLNWYLGFFR